MKFTVPALSTLLFILLASSAPAIDFKSADTFSLPCDQTISNELWLQARTITFAGHAGDDCFLLADSISQVSTAAISTVRLPGTFGADLWAAGESVEFNGSVIHHTRLAAMKTLLVAGRIDGNLMALAPTITLSTNALVGGSALLAGQDIILNGKIAGNTQIYGATVTLAGQFEGNLSVTASDINVMPGTRIAGNLVYRMDRDLVLDSRVEVGGKMIKAEHLQPEKSASTSANLLLQLGLLCGAILTGLVFVSLMPGIVALSVHKLGESPWRCILFGFVAFALIPMTAFFLIFTLVGIPLSATLVLADLILMYLGKIVVGLHVGHLIIRRKTPIPPNLLFPVMSLGLLLLYTASSLPFPVGIAFWFMITLAGMGSLVGAMLDRRIPVMINYSAGNQGKPPPLPGMPPGAV
jgi:cytoskeletal protein CcmA (bactofilin family)